MTVTPEELARTAAARLARDLDPALPAYVERQLQAGDSGRERYIEPGTAIALASLLVSIATLAWTIYRDLKQEAEKPSRELVKTRVRVEVEIPQGFYAQQRDQMIECVVELLE